MQPTTKLSNWKKTLNRILLPYQTNYLNNRSRYLVVEKSRRIGITWSSALKSVLKRVIADKPIDHLFSSADEKAGIEFMHYCKFWAEKINELMGDDIVPVNTWTSETAKFANGSRILILSSNPRSFRSKQGDVTWDEAAFHEDQDEIYKAAQPCILWLPDAQFEIISTHNGVGTLFYRIASEARNNPNSPWKLARTTLVDAVDQGFALKVWRDRIEKYRGDVALLNSDFIADVRRGCATEEDFQQEYMCEPAMRMALVSQDEYEKLVLVNPDGTIFQIPTELDYSYKYNELYVGIDCGRTNDLTVVWVLEKGIDDTAPAHLRDVYRTVCVKSFKNETFPVQEAFIRAIVSHPSISKGFIDMGLVGRGLADAVYDETGEVVEPYAMTAPRMAVMAERVRQFVQQMRVSMHPHPMVKTDVCSVRRVQQEGGGRKYEGRTQFSHGDFFWALALALQAADESNHIQVIGRPVSEWENTMALALPSK